MDFSPLLEELQKKDEDVRVLEETIDGYLVETSLPIGTPLEEIEFGPAAQRPDQIQFPLAVPTRIIRHVFMLNTAVVFFFTVFGLVPAHLLSAVFPAALALFLTAFAIVWILAIVLVFRPHAVVFFLFIVALHAVVFSISALLKSLAPFQLCSIFFVQYISGLVFCLFMDKSIDPLGAAGVMLVSGLGIWALGLYSFIAEQDWITSCILFFFGVLFAPFYWALQIRHINRYSLSEADLLQASINFFLDPVQWMFAQCVRRARAQFPAPVDESSIALISAVNEVSTSEPTAIQSD